MIIIIIMIIIITTIIIITIIIIIIIIIIVVIIVIISGLRKVETCLLAAPAAWSGAVRRTTRFRIRRVLKLLSLWVFVLLVLL